MCGARADGSREAAGAGESVSVVAECADAYPGATARERGAACVAGIVPRVGDYDYEGGAVYRDSVSALGGDEGVADETNGESAGEWVGGGCAGECGRGGSCGGDDAVGCA